jgi:hypothetical protein
MGYSGDVIDSLKTDSTDYFRNISFEERLKELNYRLKAKDGNEREVCEELSKLKTRKFIGRQFKDKELDKRFIHSIRKLNPDIIEFYKNSDIKLVRNKSFQTGVVKLIEEEGTRQIALTDKPLKQSDFTSYAYTLGSVPTIVNEYQEEYYDYQKVFPIFLEYLACLELDKEHGKDIFVDIRMDKSKRMALFYLFYDNNVEHDRKFENNKVEVFKHIKSLEFVLELLDKMKEDRSVVNDELSKYVLEGKSFREIGETLDISATGSKKLLKEFGIRK